MGGLVPRFASLFWTLTWAEETLGAAHQAFSAYDLWLATPVQFRPLRVVGLLIFTDRALVCVVMLIAQFGLGEIEVKALAFSGK